MTDNARREYLNDDMVKKAMAMRVPEFAARYAFEVANALQPDNIQFQLPGCGHLLVTYALKQPGAWTLGLVMIKDLDEKDTDFSAEKMAIDIAELSEARDKAPEVIKAANEPKPEGKLN